ncbi:MAG: 50S ribosomal protein L11 methyltransferase [Gammaproteobacteria bacterium]|nr:50S ribosomal protein L11 methyltransferase [Gammaproteobacteria bacterium]MCW8840937.1 50S ribosomal protein L11 methyltransferase [Gammaproteobacteria bacterium]MCW8927484.1 50S ribosomal protein L11 methyltransferase [Gammaproteobacteria bacterium]MCW8959491.1 50S ribosomal protein L11 methyltransferase [Gammaproteobacteria bacterium]MCW8971784.1 50S ribosomal protein L11 methyltransferase [Gammaproteobacteria bacterium]
MPWLQLTFYSNKDKAEALADLLSETGAAAVSMQDAADQPLYEPPPGATPLWQLTNVVALFDENSDGGGVIEQLKAAWPEALPEYRSEILADQDWERAWMDDFKPMKFGERLWIVPSWHEAPQQDGVNILLDPGLAFGTGTHPTTRLCLEWLDGQALHAKRVIDYGCGSGILAIAAALLGAASVIGVDNDPQALVATQDNAQRNGVSILTSLPAEVPQNSVDILLANILAGPLIELAPKLAALVKPGGLIALSGILPDQANGVRQTYAQWFNMEAPVEVDGWIRLEGKKRTD